jgi:hypothetical protein
MPFKKGQSGNPGGRKPALPIDLIALCRADTRESVETLIEIRKDKDAPHSARVKAAETIINRGWGTAPQTIKVEGEIVVHTKRIEVVRSSGS